MSYTAADALREEGYSSDEAELIIDNDEVDFMLTQARLSQDD